MTRTPARLYAIGSPLLFRLDPELAHRLALEGLKRTQPLWARSCPPVGPAIECCGLKFANRLGLAAGCDKNGDYIDALGALGFGHLEVGAVTPRPQPGNAKPRLFRIPEIHAIVNRMGFNNQGVQHLVGRLRSRTYRGVLGVNIGKNFDTPLERAHEDYLYCFQHVYPHADYVVLNVSSPNTAGLRTLQLADGLRQIAAPVLDARARLEMQHGRRVAVLVKIAPDLDPAEVAAIAQQLRAIGVDGVVATNTTTRFDDIPGTLPIHKPGGLSGAPLLQRSLEVVRQLRNELGTTYPIIGVGGISSGKDAAAMVSAGANLVQIYSGFVYRGPALVDEILRTLPA